MKKELADYLNNEAEKTKKRMKIQHTPKLPECFKGEFFVEVLENNDTGENTFNIMSDIPNGSLCEVINDISEDVAHEVVKRVNLHDELVKGLESLKSWLQSINMPINSKALQAWEAEAMQNASIHNNRLYDCGI